MAGDPHPNPNEDPEQHIGAKMPDPWADDAQKDWTTFDLVVTAPAPGEVSD